MYELAKGSSASERVKYRLPSFSDSPFASVPSNPPAFRSTNRKATRNWAGYGESVDMGRYGDIEQALLSDPQTSGGLLVTCAPDCVDEVLALFRSEGFNEAAVIGEVTSGVGRVAVI